MLIPVSGALASDTASPQQAKEASIPVGAAASDFVLPPVESLVAKPGQQRVTYKSCQFKGNTVIDTATLEKLCLPYLNRSIDAVVDVEQLRVNITQHYIDAGYINSGALVFPPENGEGDLWFEIIEGRLTNFDIKGLEGLNQSYLTSRVWPDQERPLNLNVLQQKFQSVLADPLFKKINSRVEPGAKRGEAVLNLEVERARPWEAYVAFDNYRSPASGENQFSAGFTLRNMTSFGDALSLSAYKPVDNAATNGYSISWSLPVTTTTTLSLSADKGQTSVTQPPFDRLNFANKAKGESVSITQMLLNEPQYSLYAAIDHSRRHSQNYIAGQPYTLTLGEQEGLTENTVDRFSLTYSLRQPEYSLAARLTHSIGKHNYAVDPVLQQYVTTPVSPYQVDLLQGFFSYRLSQDGLAITLRGSMQKATKQLISMEKFSPTSINAVRGYEQNQYAFDNANAVSIELPLPVWRIDNVAISATPFYDIGEGYNVPSINKTVVRTKFAAAGIGVQVKWDNLLMSLSWAQRLENKTQASNTRYQQSNGVQYRLQYSF